MIHVPAWITFPEVFASKDISKDTCGYIAQHNPVFSYDIIILRYMYTLAPDKALFFNQIVLIFLSTAIYAWVLIRCTSARANEYPQYMFSCRNKKKYLPVTPYLERCRPLNTVFILITTLCA